MPNAISKDLKEQILSRVREGKTTVVEIASQHGLEFYAADFKKKDGFTKSLRLSREAGLYRQDYCGCEFSKEERERRNRERGEEPTGEALWPGPPGWRPPQREEQIHD